MQNSVGVDTVIKLGGGVLADVSHFDIALEAIGALGREHRLLVVPGGGPFADVVRDVDHRLSASRASSVPRALGAPRAKALGYEVALGQHEKPLDHGLSDDAAHWMAVLGMDQYAELIASRLAGAVLVTGVDEIVAAAASAGQVPVLAPSRWLREADPLPHSWDVTSDSIAAWVAGALGARRLVLIKPPGVTADSMVDPYFSHALPSNVDVLIMRADRIAELLVSSKLL